MTRIVVVTGSARPSEVNKIMTEYVAKKLEAKNVEVKVADIATMNLPFFDAATPPSAEGYEAPHESVREWGKTIDEADGVVFVVPEYNHSLSAIQKNAIDWLYTEWNEKPAAFVGYGWYGAKHSHAHFIDVNDVVKMKLGETFTGLTFMKELNVDGSFADEQAAEAAVDATLDELLTAAQ
jgi:NAD(P)H-dependent FMN reductase